MEIVDYPRLKEILTERRNRFFEVEVQVAKIIEEVKKGGAAALRKLTEQYDGVVLSDFLVSPAEIKEASCFFADELWQKRLERVVKRLRSFAEKEVLTGFSLTGPEGTVERVYEPLSSVGVYVPAGTAPLVSTVLMAVIPAQVAGVKRIVLTTPPKKDGKASVGVVAAAAFLGVTEIYKVGGSQAIAALALGVEPIPKVAKIVGPGNEYVAAAKRLLYGFVDIDCPAGPSEVVVFADQSAPLSFVLAELASQAEHHGGLAILLTPDQQILKAAAEKTVGFGMQASRSESLRLIAEIAPEHLSVMSKDAAIFASEVQNAGAIFIGDYTPVAVGDYLAGPSHILPTGGAAASFSGLSVLTFLRSFARICWKRDGLMKWAEDLTALAELEGLPAHKESVEIRFK